ncbi:MAG TPA: hypothetical protein ENF96_01425 [Archaeoglobus veneficus]|nr:hypothetical protein [Archaeoglobus veneficus]
MKMYYLEDVVKAKRYLVKLVEGKIKGCTSVLTWDEVVHAVRKNAGKEESLVAGRKFLSFPNLKIYAVDFEVVLKAHELVENFNIKPRCNSRSMCLKTLRRYAD